jgi:hypothetical protein
VVVVEFEDGVDGLLVVVVVELDSGELLLVVVESVVVF